MVYIQNSLKKNYIQKQRKVEEVKYGNGIYSPSIGKAIFLPIKKYHGESITDVLNWVSSDQDMLKNVANTTANVVDSAGKVTNTVLDTVKRIKELNKQGLTNKGLEKVLRATPTEKTGSGFYLIK